MASFRTVDGILLNNGTSWDFTLSCRTRQKVNMPKHMHTLRMLSNRDQTLHTCAFARRRDGKHVPVRFGRQTARRR